MTRFYLLRTTPASDATATSLIMSDRNLGLMGRHETIAQATQRRLFLYQIRTVANRRHFNVIPIIHSLSALQLFVTSSYTFIIGGITKVFASRKESSANQLIMG